MIENSKSKIRQFLPRHCLFPLVSLGDFLRKKAFSRNPEIAVNYSSLEWEENPGGFPPAFRASRVGSSMILVTGATGNLGGDVVRGLLELDPIGTGRPVRAAVTDPIRARRTLPEHAELIRFDFTDPSSFGPALEGVTRVFLMRPPVMGDPKAFQPFLEAMKSCNVQQVVFLSLLGAQHNPVVPHRKLELAIEKLELPHVFSRPSFFLQNLSTTHLQDLLERNDLFVPAGNGRTSFIDARDIAAIAVRALTVPHIVNGGIDLTGAEALTYSQVATVFSEVLGRRITYSNPAPPKFGLEMQQRGMKPAFVNIMILIYNMNRFGLAARVTNDVERILGRKPISVRRFVEDFKPIFTRST